MSIAPCWLEDVENGLSDDFRVQLSDLWNDLLHLDERVDMLSKRLARVVKEDPVAQRLSTLRGVSPLGASALAVALGDGSAYASGRDFAASLGLVPRQHSTGGKERLLGISKRGNCYIRTLLVHDARAVMRHSKDRDDELSRWVNALNRRVDCGISILGLFRGAIAKADK